MQDMHVRGKGSGRMVMMGAGLISCLFYNVQSFSYTSASISLFEDASVIVSVILLHQQTLIQAENPGSHGRNGRCWQLIGRTWQEMVGNCYIVVDWQNLVANLQQTLGMPVVFCRALQYPQRPVVPTEPCCYVMAGMFTQCESKCQSLL